MSDEIKLKVAEAIQDDVNKGIVRFDSNFMHQLGVKTGDIVEIEGERKTVSIVDRAYPGDIGLNIIRTDGLIRRNAKTGIGEYVTVRKAKVEVAKKIVIAPSQTGIRIDAPPAIFRHRLLGRAVVKGDIISLGGVQRRKSAMSDSMFSDIFGGEDIFGAFGFMDFKFVVVDVHPKGAVIITDKTEIEYKPEAVEVEEGDPLPDVTYEDIGGLDDELKKIRELVELPLKYPELFEQLGIEPPKGILLHGPPGTGKTHLAKAVATETNSNFYVINGPEIMSKFYGESEANLRKKFEEAEKNAPSVIFIDEIDAIGASREESKGEVERRVVAQMLAIMDGLKSRGRVVVIAATNIPNSLDPALRRPGRFDREIEIAPPSKFGRSEILKIHTRNMPFDTSLQSLHINQTSEEIWAQHMQALKTIDVQDIARIIYERTSKYDALPKHIRTQLNEDIREIVHKDYEAQRNLPPSIKHQLANRVAMEFILASASQKSRETLETLVQQLASKLEALQRQTSFREIQEDLGRNVIIDQVASTTHGFVGADLASLTREAAMVVLRRVIDTIDLDKDERIPAEKLESLKITIDDFTTALRTVRPSALREVLVEVPNIGWTEIGGLKDVKQQLTEAVEWPLRHPDRFRRLGITPPKGILLYGPPGTGKTLLAKAVANESEANFIQVKGPELLSKWVGESEKGVRKIFAKARQAAPTIIFFDEIDAIAPRRGGGGASSSDSGVTERMVNQMLTEIDGLESLNDVVIIAATNRPDIIDPALMRPGRFDRVILVPVPDGQARYNILKIHTRNMPLAEDIDLLDISERHLDGFVGADIEGIVREAAMRSLRRSTDAKVVTKADFLEAIKNTAKSVSPDVSKLYEEFRNIYSSAQAGRIKEDRQVYFG